MTVSATLRARVACVAAVATVILTAGISVLHEADHAGDRAHIEQGHGGHDQLVIVDAGRVTSPHAAPATLPFLPITVMPSDTPPALIRAPVDVVPHPGRDPPGAHPPRGPPLRSS